MNTEKLRRNEEQLPGVEEKPSKLDVLVERGEWERLNESDEFREMTVEGRIVTTQKAVKIREKQLELSFGHALARHREQSTVILDKMRYLRRVEDALDETLAENIKREQTSKRTNLKKAA